MATALDAQTVLTDLTGGVTYPAGEPLWEEEPERLSVADQVWWAEHCDHSGWPAESELSHEDQCMEALTLSEIEYHMSLVDDRPR